MDRTVSAVDAVNRASLGHKENQDFEVPKVTKATRRHFMAARPAQTVRVSQQSYINTCELNSVCGEA